MNPPMTPASEEMGMRFSLVLASLIEKTAMSAADAVLRDESPDVKATTTEARALIALHREALARAEEAEASFKNFHRSLCARFGYTHDERDWRRDQVSLEEHIAAKIERPAEPPVTLLGAMQKAKEKRVAGTPGWEAFENWWFSTPHMGMLWDDSWAAWQAALASRPTGEK